MPYLSRFCFIWLILLIQAACSTPPTSPPAPTPQVVTVSLPTALRPLNEVLNTCRVAHPELAIIVNEAPATALEVEPGKLVFWLGVPPTDTGYSAPIATEEILVIINPANDIDELSAGEVRSLFTGRTTHWEEAGISTVEVQVWVYPEGNEIRRIFDTATEGAIITTQARLAPSPAAMLEATSDDPAAIGYLPRAWLNTGVKSVSLDEETSAALRQPVLVLASSEPEGAGRTLLLCLQGSPGQKVLAERYLPWETNR